jgi:hypothetical protein
LNQSASIGAALLAAANCFVHSVANVSSPVFVFVDVQDQAGTHKLARAVVLFANQERLSVLYISHPLHGNH